MSQSVPRDGFLILYLFHLLPNMQLSKNRVFKIPGTSCFDLACLIAFPLTAFLLHSKWWTQLDLNQRPPPYQGGALTN
jgi:hypothetical protein